MAKVIPIKKIEAWSFSRWSDYEKCPALAKYKHIDKLKEPPNEAMERGTAIHKMAEDYLKGKSSRLATELKLFSAEFKHLRSQKVRGTEEQWTFRKDWTETTWNDWNGAWLRVKMDVFYINEEHNALVPIDFKTGKYREDKNAEYMLQLELYGLSSLKRFPTVDVVSPRLWYLDEGVTYPNPEQEEIEYTRADEARLEKLWAARTKRMFADTTFKPTPGNACRFCHFRKSNNGPCRY